MNSARLAAVIARDGRRGTFERSALKDKHGEVLVRFDDGEQVLLPPDALEEQTDGSYRLSAALDHLKTTVPVLSEELRVGRRVVETGKVRVRKLVREHEETVDEPDVHEEVHVERVPMNREVDAPPSVRQEGDTTIIPVLREEPVVAKRLVLVEEVRITRTRREVHHPTEVTLRDEEVLVDRLRPGRSEAPEG